MEALKMYTRIISKRKFYKLDALKHFQKLTFFVNDSNCKNAENSAAIEHFLHFPFSLLAIWNQGESRKGFYGSETIIESHTNRLKEGPNRENCECAWTKKLLSAYKAEKGIYRQANGGRNGILVYHINLPASSLTVLMATQYGARIKVPTQEQLKKQQDHTKLQYDINF